MRQRCSITTILLTALLTTNVSAQNPGPDESLRLLESRIAALLKPENPPLFSWHLRSLRSLARTEYAKLDLNIDQRPNITAETRRKEFVDYLTTITQGLQGDGGNPDLYLKEGRRALVLARPSAIDGSLQWTTVDLPKGWDPHQAYPLFVGLHGTGPDHPLAYPSYASGTAPADRPARATDGMIGLGPWGRGNRGWRGDAETDLFEAIAMVKTFAKLDPDRWYITGHSAGADGLWAIVQHTPDLWAAAGPQSGSMLAGRPEWGLVPNLVHVPFYFLIGENDNLPSRVPDTKEAHRLLKSLGGEAEIAVLPGVGHYPLPSDALEAQARWMVKFVRRRPSNFSFTVDQPNHPGIWGIQVIRNASQARFIKEPWPTFSCEIKGQEVRLQTKNIERLNVDLGLSGLGLNGNVRLWVDGKKVHDGPVPAKPVEFKIDVS